MSEYKVLTLSASSADSGHAEEVLLACAKCEVLWQADNLNKQGVCPDCQEKAA